MAGRRFLSRKNFFNPAIVKYTERTAGARKESESVNCEGRQMKGSVKERKEYTSILRATRPAVVRKNQLDVMAMEHLPHDQEKEKERERERELE